MLHTLLFFRLRQVHSQNIPVGSASTSHISFSSVSLFLPVGYGCRLFFLSYQYNVQFSDSGLYSNWAIFISFQIAGSIKSGRDSVRVALLPLVSCCNFT